MSPRPSRITPEYMVKLACIYMRQHGPAAVGFADQAIAELEAQDEDRGADAWRALRSIMRDILAGKLEKDAAPTVH